MANSMYENTLEYSRHKVLLQEIFDKKFEQWNCFKLAVDQLSVSYLDHTFIPQFNSCYKLVVSYGQINEWNTLVTYYISVLHPAFCYLSLSIKDGSKIKFEWNDVPIQIYEKHHALIQLIQHYFERHQEIDTETLRSLVPGYQLEGEMGQDNLFSFIFMYDPQYSKTLAKI